jgi:hypothetical protein
MVLPYRVPFSSLPHLPNQAILQPHSLHHQVVVLFNCNPSLPLTCSCRTQYTTPKAQVCCPINVSLSLASYTSPHRMLSPSIHHARSCRRGAGGVFSRIYRILVVANNHLSHIPFQVDPSTGGMVAAGNAASLILLTTSPNICAGPLRLCAVTGIGRSWSSHLPCDAVAPCPKACLPNFKTAFFLCFHPGDACRGAAVASFWW